MKPRSIAVFATTLTLALAVSDAAAQENAPDTVVLTGSRLGQVSFSHVGHADLTECVTCHHESRPEKPSASTTQPCTACHTSSPAPPMTTSIADAYHDRRATAGLCIDCHKEEAETAAEPPPLRCNECHVKKEQ